MNGTARTDIQCALQRPTRPHDMTSEFLLLGFAGIVFRLESQRDSSEMRGSFRFSVRKPSTSCLGGAVTVRILSVVEMNFR